MNLPEVTVEHINNEVSCSPEKFIQKCENDYRNRLNHAADLICSGNNRLVMLAGPSSSGKTTTAGMLKKEIESRGRKAKTISLDDFYNTQDIIYKFEDGTEDFETVNALDVEMIIGCLNSLTEKGSCFLPRFNFMTKSREKQLVETFLDDGETIIVEGLHALNPVITDNISEISMVKLYVSVSTRIFDEGQVFLTKRDLRFIRRLIRDYHFRNSEVEYTFYLWNGVRKGEDRYLFPYSDRADIKIDSIHPYEPCVYKDIALKLLDHIDENSVYYPMALSLKEKLSCFIGLSEKDVPENSLLNEFIGMKN